MMFRFCCLIAASVIAGVVFGAEPSIEIDHILGGKPASVADTLNDNYRNKLLSFGVGAAELKEWQLPGKLALYPVLLDSKNYPLSLSAADGGLQVRSRGQVLLRYWRYLKIFPDYEYDLTGTVSGNGKVIISYRITERYAQEHEVEIKVSGKEVNFSVEGGLADNLSNVPISLCLAVSGDVEFHELKLSRRRLPSAAFAEGRIKEISALPALKNLNYPDCNYAAKVVFNSIYGGSSIPQEVVLVIPGIRDYKYTGFAGFKPGDLICCKVINFEDLPKEQREIQLVDQINALDDPLYYALNARKIDSFGQEGSGISFTSIKEYRSPWHSIDHPAPDPEVAESRRKAIAGERAKVDRLLSEYENRKKEWSGKFNELQESGKKKFGTVNSKFWMEKDGAFFAWPARGKLFSDSGSLSPEKLQAIRNFSDYLASNGVQLIIQVIPYYDDISMRAVFPEFSDTVDLRSATVVKQLLEKDIDAMYVSDALVKDATRKELLFLYPNDPHPGDGCQDILTDLIAKRLAPFKFSEAFNLDPAGFSRKKSLTVSGDKYCWPGGVPTGKHQPGTPVMCDQVLYRGAPLKSDPAAEIMIMGNSFIRTPVAPSSYAAYLAEKLGKKLTWHISELNGPFSTLPRQFFLNPELYLKGKKVVVFPIGVMYLLNDSAFLDLKAIDEFKRMLVGKEMIGRIALEYSGDAETHRKSEAVWHPMLVGRWNAFFENGEPGTRIAVADRQSAPVLLELKLPDGYDPSREAVLVVTAACFLQQRTMLKIGDQVRLIPTGNYDVVWSQLPFAMAPGEQPLTMEILADQDHTLLAIKELAIYQ